MTLIPILVSRCLLGDPCRYDGGSKPNADVLSFIASFDLRPIPVCPESDGGLPTPRPAGERVGDEVLTQDGRLLTDHYRRGAWIALQAAKENHVAFAILKAKSPSCGVGEIYDGSFSRTLTPGDGVTAELLKKNGIPVFTERDLETESLLSLLKQTK